LPGGPPDRGRRPAGPRPDGGRRDDWSRRDRPGRQFGDHAPTADVRAFQPSRRFESPTPELSELVAPDEELIAGRRPVEEAFVAGREARRLIVVPQRRQALERLVLHATSLRIPIVEVEGGTLTALSGFDGHQGIAVVVPARRYATLDEVLARAIERGEPPFVLALDSLEDPQNVGTLLRSAEAAGVHGVLFPTHRQAPLTPAAVKASAGAVEHLLLCPVDDLPGALADLHGRGIRVLGAEAGAPLTAREADMRGPLAIVVGSEGQGLGPAVRSRCDMLVRIPLRGAIDSLNAAVAGSILLFEAVAQRHGPETGEPALTPTQESASPSIDEPVSASTEEPGVNPPDQTEPSRKRRRSKSVAIFPPGDAAAPDSVVDVLLPGETNAALEDAVEEPPPAPKRRRRQA
jgi:23S rRNA (guanosine2251-2'-O)-methyltransferase